MSYKHTPFMIKKITADMKELALKSSTPKKYSGMLFEGAEIIEELQAVLAEYRKYDGFLYAHGCFVEVLNDEVAK